MEEVIELSVLAEEVSTVQGQTDLIITGHIKTVVEMQAANDFRAKVLKPLMAKVHKGYDDLVHEADVHHKNLVARRKEYLDPLDKAYKAIGVEMARYDEQVREAARKEQARMDEIVRKEREKEQEKADKKIAAILEKAGGIQEQIDALKAEIEASSNVMEIEKMERQVEVLTRKLEAAQVKAAEVAQAAEEVYEMPAPVIQAKPQVQGMSTRQVTEVVSIDIRKLAEAVFMGTAPIGVFDANEGAIKKLVDAGLTLSGVVTRKKTIVNTRS